MSATCATNSATTPTHLCGQDDPSKESSGSDSEEDAVSFMQSDSDSDDTINKDPYWYIGWADEGPAVTNLFWDVWCSLPEDLGYTWQEVLDNVKMKIEGQDMGMVDIDLFLGDTMWLTFSITNSFVCFSWGHPGSKAKSPYTAMLYTGVVKDREFRGPRSFHQRTAGLVVKAKQGSLTEVDLMDVRVMAGNGQPGEEMEVDEDEEGDTTLDMTTQVSFIKTMITDLIANAAGAGTILTVIAALAKGNIFSNFGSLGTFLKRTPGKWDIHLGLLVTPLNSQFGVPHIGQLNEMTHAIIVGLIHGHNPSSRALLVFDVNVLKTEPNKSKGSLDPCTLTMIRLARADARCIEKPPILATRGPRKKGMCATICEISRKEPHSSQLLHMVLTLISGVLDGDMPITTLFSIFAPGIGFGICVAGWEHAYRERTALFSIVAPGIGFGISVAGWEHAYRERTALFSIVAPGIGFGISVAGWEHAYATGHPREKCMCITICEISQKEPHHSQPLLLVVAWIFLVLDGGIPKVTNSNQFPILPPNLHPLLSYVQDLFKAQGEI
ncbi:hypothetical protein B0H14DRAFT_2610937 [Mycena olivaceomarginata]|nr:hypothetical protein B0H14DRAFT_2610937 [Mycena olivaceomarginata]